jgi:hypothetical protein
VEWGWRKELLMERNDVRVGCGGPLVGDGIWLDGNITPPPVTKAIRCSCSSSASGVQSGQNTYIYFAIKDLLISK